MNIVNKKTRELCWDADCETCAQSTDESLCAFAWAFNPQFLVTGGPLPDHQFDEQPLLAEEERELKQALHHLRRIATSAKSPWLRFTALIGYESIRMILGLFNRMDE